VLSSILELLSEPPFVIAQNLLWFNVRVWVEASAMLVRCVLIFVLISWFKVCIDFRVVNLYFIDLVPLSLMLLPSVLAKLPSQSYL